MIFRIVLYLNCLPFTKAIFASTIDTTPIPKPVVIQDSAKVGIINMGNINHITQNFNVNKAIENSAEYEAHLATVKDLEKQLDDLNESYKNATTNELKNYLTKEKLIVSEKLYTEKKKLKNFIKTIVDLYERINKIDTDDEDAKKAIALSPRNTHRTKLDCGAMRQCHRCRSFFIYA